MFVKDIPMWYELKLVLVAWLVLPQFRGVAFICVCVRKICWGNDFLNLRVITSFPPSSKTDNKFVGLVTPNKVSLFTQQTFYVALGTVHFVILTAGRV